MGTVEPPGSTNAIGSSPAPTYIGPRESDSGHAAGSLWVALAANLLIGSIKLTAWGVTRSPAVFSEALHSYGDAANSVALIYGNTISRRPPDRTHPFGYGLEANLWTIPACVALVFLSGWAIYEGIQRLYHPEHTFTQQVLWMDGYSFSVLVLLLSISLEIWAVHRASQAILEELSLPSRNVLDTFAKAFANFRLVVGPTTKFVFMEDTIALVGASLALGAITLSHYAVEWGLMPEAYAHYPDSIASMIIGGLLIVMAVYLFRHNRGVLTQTAASPNVESKIQSLVTNMSGVSEVLDLKTIDHGLAGLTIHLQVQVDPYTLVKDVDDLTERIKERIQSRIGEASKVFVEVLADESEIEWGEKFEALIDQGKAEGVLDKREAQILMNVYDFTESTVRDIMIPRIDVECVELQTPLSEVADLIIETGHTRLPVYKEYVDDLVGLVHARDVFERIRNGQLETPLFEIVREIDIYPENKPIGDLLEDFKRNKIRIAAVADEHGGFSGLVTVEDVIEEIIGELWDEHDEEDPMLTVLGPNKVLVNGKYDIEDLNERLDLAIPFDEFKTVGGYVFGALGREPEAGDTVDFEDLRFMVSEVEGPRIVSVVLESPVPFQMDTEEEPEAAANGNGHAEAVPDESTAQGHG